MRVGVVSLFPSMIEDALAYGVVGRAVRDGHLELLLENPRDWTTDKHGTVDDRPFGGGPGMVMKPQPLQAAIKSLRNRLGPQARVIYLSPQGKRFDQATARQWVSEDELILVAGRYEGIDERVVTSTVDEEISIGDFVLSGGEFAALALIDALTRLLPGVLGDPQSSLQDSFGEDGLLDCPHFTRPESHDGQTVPAVLLSGDHQAIACWRRQQALLKTLHQRPDMLLRARLSADDRLFLTSHGYRAMETDGSH